MYKGSSSVISICDLHRIKFSCSNSQDPIDSKQKKLREASRKRAEKWGNTLEASRKNKDAQKKKERDEKEKYFQKLDAEEARIREEKRRKCLARAEKIQFLQNEKVKAMNTVLHQADIMEEWNEQQIVKEKLKKLREIEDQRYITLEKTQMKEYDEKENKKWMNISKNKRETARQQQEQLKGKNKLKELEKERVKQDHKKILKHIKQVNLDIQKENEKRQLHHEKMKKQMVEELNNQLVMKTQKKKEEAMVDAKIKKYFEQKEKIKKQRKLEAAKMRKAKQEKRQKMIDEQTELLRKLKNRQNQVLDKQKEEAEQKFLDVEKRKKEKQAILRKECKEQMALQLEKKEREKQRELQEDLRLGEIAHTDAVAYENAEKEKFVRFRKEAMKVRKFQKQQILTQYQDKYRNEQKLDECVQNEKRANLEEYKLAIDYVNSCGDVENLGYLAQEVVTSHINKMNAIRNNRF